MLAMVLIQEQVTNRIVVKITAVILLCLIALTLALPSTVSAFAGLGGYISEKLLGDGTNEALYLGDGASELTVLGSGPIVSTVGATSKSEGGVVTMAMTGELQSLNGMPQADVWFAWGHSAGTMTNPTVVNTLTSAGLQTAVIYPDVGKEVFYQFRSSTDGISYGEVKSLIAGGGHGVSYWMLNTLLPIVIAGIILVTVLLLTGNPILALVASIVGLAGFYIVLALVSSF